MNDEKIRQIFSQSISSCANGLGGMLSKFISHAIKDAKLAEYASKEVKKTFIDNIANKWSVSEDWAWEYKKGIVKDTIEEILKHEKEHLKSRIYLFLTAGMCKDNPQNTACRMLDVPNEDIDVKEVAEYIEELIEIIDVFFDSLRACIFTAIASAGVKI